LKLLGCPLQLLVAFLPGALRFRIAVLQVLLQLLACCFQALALYGQTLLMLNNITLALGENIAERSTCTTKGHVQERFDRLKQRSC
jgi:hypothetical protein